jgi:hypothetical protein
MHEEVVRGTVVLSSPPQFRIWLSASGDLTVATGLDPQAAANASDAIRAVLSGTNVDYLSLLGRSLAVGLDPVVDFVVAFTALEQFLKARAPGKLGLRRRLEGLVASSAGFGPEDLQEFDRLYAVRNDLAHEGRLVPDRTSADRVRSLLQRLLVSDPKPGRTELNVPLQPPLEQPNPR